MTRNRPQQHRPRHRLPTAARPRLSRRRLATGAGIVLAVALVVAGVLIGVELGRSRHSDPQATTANPAVLPAEVPRTVVATNSPAAPIPLAAPGCGDTPALLASMSTRDKLAQLLMVGVTGEADARTVVADHHVGGIFIGSWTDLSMLTNGAMTAIAASAGPLHLAVSVDEEGGRVSRLSSLIGSAPSARELAQSESAEQVYQLALERGRKMRRLGITVDMAPVVDVTDSAADTVIGDRPFSAQTAVVTEYARAYARGLRSAGLLPVLKHFPGHGHASGDSHTSGVVTPPLDELQDIDLVPYRTLVAEGPVGVMVGHMQVPGLTGNEPASLNRTQLPCCAMEMDTVRHRSMVRCSPMTCPACGRSQTGTAWAKQC